MGSMERALSGTAGTRRRLRPGGAVFGPALAQILAAALILAGVEVALMADGPISSIWQIYFFPGYGLLYIFTGLFAWARRPSNGMGALIVAGGFTWLAAGLPNTAIPSLIAIGLIVATLPLAVIVHLLHAFPSGRLRGTASKWTVAVGYFVVLILQMPIYLWGQGEKGGPTTVLEIADDHTLSHIGQYLQAAVGAAVMVSTAIILTNRLRRTEPSRRRVVAPLMIYGSLAVLFVPLSSFIGETWMPQWSLGIAFGQLTVMAGVPVAFVAVVLSGGFATSGEVHELGATLDAEEGRPALRATLRDVLGDPHLDLLFRVDDPDRYVDREGATAEPPLPGSDRRLVEVRVGERLVGAIVYDATLIAERGLVEDAARVTALAIDNERLTAELRAGRERLRVSRARVIEATDAERRRIARDLHDGLQMRLVLLAMMADRPGADEETMAELNAGLQEAITELRELVQGVVPAALTERGLYAAAVELTDRMPMPVELDFEPLPGDLPIGIETAGYFVVSEALANAVKHSHAEELRLSIGRPAGRLRIEVVDDGIGGALPGGGLSGLADRVDALGGWIEVESPPGEGTRLVAELPCENAASAEALPEGIATAVNPAGARISKELA
ncbi:MAG: integral rane sensor signal transduction histidine kinase [Solirubrobacterales bacterium]|nr:integral rane sensor signal transduction histidine kinase [Solirubrobacterales bacterium]